MTQVVECLPSKYEALNSKPSTTKKKKKKGRGIAHVAEPLHKVLEALGFIPSVGDGEGK
jgi:hypothetical protein